MSKSTQFSMSWIIIGIYLLLKHAVLWLYDGNFEYMGIFDCSDVCSIFYICSLYAMWLGMSILIIVL